MEEFCDALYRVTLAVGLACPLLRALRQEGTADVVLSRCVPRPQRSGATALMKLRALPELGSREVAEALARTGLVEKASFSRLGNSALLGLVSTKACPCMATPLPYTVTLNVEEEGEGWLRWTLLAADAEELREVTRGLSERGIEYRFKDISKLKRPLPHTRLTPRQEQLLRAALEMGFYEVPKRAGLRELSELFGASPRALSESFRRAHRKLVASALLEA